MVWVYKVQRMYGGCATCMPLMRRRRQQQKSNFEMRVGYEFEDWVFSGHCDCGGREGRWRWSSIIFRCRWASSRGPSGVRTGGTPMSSVSFTLSILFVPSCLFLALTILVEGKSRAYHVSSSSFCLTPWEGNKLDTFSQVHHPDATHLLQLEHTNRCVHS
jgi:hypothetical protein